MLGSTMAWFEDTKVVINTFTFGNLDVDIMKGSDGTIAATSVNFKKYFGELYSDNEEFFFEPGATFQLEDIYIKNSGDVPLRYTLRIEGGNGDTELWDAMDIYIRSSGELIDAERDAQYLDANTLSEPVQIFLHMKEEAGNAYQDLKISGAVVKVIAVQVNEPTDQAQSD